MSDHAGILVESHYDEPSFVAYVAVDERGRFHGRDLYRIVDILKNAGGAFLLFPSYVNEGERGSLYKDETLYTSKTIKKVTMLRGRSEDSIFVTIDNEFVPDLRMEIIFGVTTWNQLIYRISDIVKYQIYGIIDGNDKLHPRFVRTRIDRSELRNYIFKAVKNSQ